MADDSIKQNTTSAMASAVSDLSPVAPADSGVDPFAETKSELVTRFELLPDDVRATITDSGYQQKLFDIAKAQKLTYEELGVLETETTMVLLGMTKPADYRDELQTEIRKNDAEVDAIVKLVNEQVFAPLRGSLERLYSVPKEPADYIPDDIMIGVEDKPREPVMPPMPPRAVPTSPTATSSNSMPAAIPRTPAPALAPVSAPTPAAPAPFTTSIARPAVQNFTAGSASPSTLTSLEKNVLGAAGVVIDTPAAPAPAAPVSQIPDRANLLASIENPSQIKPNLIAEKLKAAGSTLTAAKVTDYSMPAKAPMAPMIPPTSGTAPAATPAKPYVDPYREPI